MQHLRRLSPTSLLFASLALACNSGPPPQSVKVELPELLTSTDPVLVQLKVRDASGRSESGKPPFELTVAPPEVATVTKTGTVTCAKTGDAKVTATVRGVSGSAPLRCRLVDRLEVPAVDRIDIGKGPMTLNVKALAKDGRELSDVPVTITPSKGTPLRVNGLEIIPLAVGETDLSIRSGGASRKVFAKVVRSMKPEALPMQDGRRINFSLPEGKYEIRVTLPAPKAMRIEWRGAPYCQYKGNENTSHVSTCVLQRKGGVVFDNPRFLASGTTEVSHEGVELYEVP